MDVKIILQTHFKGKTRFIDETIENVSKKDADFLIKKGEAVKVPAKSKTNSTGK